MKGIIVNCESGEVKLVEDDMPFPKFPPYIEPERINLEDLKKLVKYAKTQGWI